jgi:hypothetical protein
MTPLLLLFFLLPVGLPACAAPQRLDGRLSALRALTEKARARGAYRCAPEELAQSEAQLDFASRELDLGDVVRAREHLVLADANAKAALRLSEAAACAARPTSAPEARLRVAPLGELTKYAARLMARLGSTKEHAAI